MEESTKLIVEKLEKLVVLLSDKADAVDFGNQLWWYGVGRSWAVLSVMVILCLVGVYTFSLGYQAQSQRDPGKFYYYDGPIGVMVTSGLVVGITLILSVITGVGLVSAYLGPHVYILNRAKSLAGL